MNAVEQLARGKRTRRAKTSGVPRILLTRAEAAAACGICDQWFSHLIDLGYVTPIIMPPMRGRKDRMFFTPDMLREMVSKLPRRSS
jgi:hypothetical protein